MRKIKTFLLWLLPLVTFFFINVANSAIIDNGNYTTDTNLGINLYDVSLTAGLSYNQVLTLTNDSASELFGYRFATENELTTIISSITGLTHDFNGWSEQHEGVTAIMASYTGYTCFSPCRGSSIWGYLAAESNTTRWYPLIDYIDSSSPANSDFWGPNGGANGLNNQNSYGGSWLIKNTSVVPIPPAIFLFSSGFIALLSFKSLTKCSSGRKKHAA